MASTNNNQEDDDRPFRCDDCGKTYRRRNNLNEHRRIVHRHKSSSKVIERSAPPQRSCLDIERSTRHYGPSSGAKQLFRKGPSASRPFQCTECNHSYRQKYNLRRHHILQHRSTAQHVPIRRFKCGKCAKIFRNAKSLVQHRRTQHVARSGTASPNRKSTKNHSKHLQPTYGSTSVSMKLTQKRLVVTSGQKWSQVVTTDRPFECDECGKTYKESRNLLEHRRQHRGLLDQHSCPHCNRRFRTPSKLVQHVACVHLGEKPWQCPVCENRFSHKGHLKAHHNVVHLGQKWRRCFLCQRRFCERIDFEMHRCRAVIVGSDPLGGFLCRECGVQCFSEKEELLQHLLWHSGIPNRVIGH